MCHVALAGSKDTLKNRNSLIEKRRDDMEKARDIDLDADSEADSEADSDADSEKIFSVQAGQLLCAEFGSHCGFTTTQVMVSDFSDLENIVSAIQINHEVQLEFGILQRCGVIGKCQTLMDPAFTFIMKTCPNVTRGSVLIHQMLTGKVEVFFNGELVEYAVYQAKIANEDVMYFSFYFWHKYMLDSSQGSQTSRLNCVANYNHSHCVDFFMKYKFFSFLVSFLLHICYTLIRTCLYCVNVLIFLDSRKISFFSGGMLVARNLQPSDHNFISH